MSTTSSTQAEHGTPPHDCTAHSWHWTSPPTGHHPISNNLHTAILIRDDEQDERPIDPATLLPFEVWGIILGHFASVKSIIPLERVSRSWQRMLRGIVTPGWVLSVLGVDADWCWMGSGEGGERWRGFKSEVRRCNEMVLGQPSAIMSTEADERWIWTYAREGYVVTVVNGSKVGIRARKELAGKKEVPVEQQFGAVRWVDQQSIAEAVRPGSGKKRTVQMFATAEERIVLFVGKTRVQSSRLRVHQLLCISTKQKKILWTRAVVRPPYFPDMNLAGQDVRLHSNINRADWEAESIYHCSSNNYLTYLLRPIISTNTDMPRPPSNHPIIITTINLDTGETLHDLDWEVQHVARGQHESLKANMIQDLCSITDLPTPPTAPQHLKLFVYRSSEYGTWHLQLLQHILAQTPLPTDPDYEPFHDHHYPSPPHLLYCPIHTIFITTLPTPPTSTTRTIFITRYFTNSLDNPTLNHQRTAVWTTTLALSPTFTTAALTPSETAYYTIPTSSPLIGREYYGPTLLNPRSRLAVSTRHEFQCHPQRSQGGEVAVVVIPFRRSREDLWRERVVGGTTRMSYWSVVEARPLRILSRVEAVGKFYRERGGVGRETRSGRKEEERGVYEFKWAEVKKVAEVGDGWVVLNDAVVWFE
ncbi:hypothetical protein BJ508DRAFT_23472 [Ascobolus immersus RN42]|uniref:F-box domain-containing protein n=1 Tax=Ascobolus immersus RN42 TaxID=1160509 RepID=A0A3N4HN01_ASCIM|nr:hypothetical protein BJ508DRAFT_23472 [Ascobolus immersus RN42]